MILLTGHKGFIGSRLYEDGMVGIDLKDGLNLLTCPLPKDIGVVYHLAAQPSVESSLKDPLHSLTDILVTARLVNEYPHAKFVFVSSAAALDVTSPYGFSKKACVEYIKKFHTNYVICTLPNIYGGGGGVVDIFRRSDVVTIYGDGEQVRDFVYVLDIVNALNRAKYWPMGEYSLGSGKGTKIIDLAKNKDKIFLPERKEIRESVLQNTTPNWTPFVDVMTYIQ